MARKSSRISEAELDFALAEAERSLDASPSGARFTSLCLMAVIVARYPAGDLQDEAEDRLSAAIARCSLGHDDLAVIRRFRLDGLQADMKRLSLSRGIEPSLRRQF